MNQALRRRLFAVWSLWVWLIWLSSKELLESRHLAGVFRSLVSPPWPHGGEAARAALLALAGAGVVCLAGLGAGRVLIRFIRGPRQEPPHLIQLAAGLPALALLTQGLGWLGLATFSILAAVTVLAAGFALPLLSPLRLRTRLKPVRQELAGSQGAGRAPILLTAVTWAAGAAVVLAAFAPEVAWDAMVYHLRVPSLYLLSHKIYPIPEIFPSYFPFTGETLMMLAKNLGGDPAAKMLHTLVWLAGGFGVARLARSLWGASAAPWALALYLTIPFGMVIASRAYVEFFLVLPLIAALLVLLDNPGPARRSNLVLAGWLAGAIFGTKYLGGFVAVVLGGLVFLRHGLQPKSAIPFALSGIAACGIWLLRNFLWTGNPVYPVLLGGLRWTQADTVGWQDDAMAFRFDFNLLLTAPWYLMSKPGSDGASSPLLLTAVAVPLLWPQARRSPLWPLALILFLIWWVTAPLPRYLTPALAVVCAAAAGVVNGYGLNPTGQRWVTRLTLLVLWGSFACGVKAIEFGTNPYEAAIGKLSLQEYRGKHFRPLDFDKALETLEALTPPRGRAYILGHNFSYDLPRRVWFDFLYTRPSLYWWLKDARGPQRVRIRARQANLTHIAWHPPGGMVILGERPWLMDWTPAKLNVYLEFWRTHVREASRLPNWVIYEITTRPGRFPLPEGVVPGTEGIREDLREYARQAAH